MRIERLRALSDVTRLISSLNEKNEAVSLDIETTGLDRFNDEILSVAIAAYTGDVYIISTEHVGSLRDLNCPLILHNFKFDFQFLAQAGISLYHCAFRDTMLLHHLLDENQPHSLDHLVKTFYKDDYKEVFWATYEDFSEAPEEAQDSYAAKDVHYTLKLYHDLSTCLQKDGVPDELVASVHRFAWHLSQTELRGIGVDVDYLIDKGLEMASRVKSHEQSLRAAFKAYTDLIEEELYEHEKTKRKTEKGKAGVKRPQFNFDSGQQLQVLLYEKLGLSKQFTPARKITVDDAALARLAEQEPLIEVIRDYRESRKLYTAFFEATLERLRDSRIYPTFNVNGTVTGRTSSSEPNLQQLPSSGGVRGIYCPDPGYSFVSADFAMLETVIAAHFSRDPSLLKVILEGASIHDITAEALGITRKDAKTVNYAIQYGAGTRKIQKILKCSELEAESALARYWEAYPGLKALIDKCHSAVDRAAPLVNPFGRHRRLIPENPRDKWSVAACKRQAFNSLIQGTGADLTNKAFCQVSDELLESGDGRGLFVVHDEILLEVKAERAKHWNSRLIEIMLLTGEQAGLTVPLSAEGSGPQDRWND